MYYYIAEPLTTKAERKQIEEIKSLLSQLGIAGEFAVASPARSVEECLDLAFTKGFTTIVGIGSDALACRVAGSLARHQSERVAMGMIPLSSQQQIWPLIGARSLKEVGEILRTRRLQAIDMLQINDQAIMVPATIQTERPVRFQLQYKEARLFGQCTDVLIKPTGEITLTDRTYGQKGGLLGRLFGRTVSPENGQTQLIGEQWDLATETGLKVTVGGQIISQTPLSVKHRPKALKLIVNRAKITPDKESKER